MVLLVSYVHLELQTNVPLTGLLSSAKWILPSCTPVSGLCFLPSPSFHPFLTCALQAQDSPLLLWMARVPVPFSRLCPCVGCAPAHIAHSPLTWWLTISECTAGKAHTCLHPNDNTLVERFLVLVSSYMPKCLKQEKERSEERIFTK